MLGTTRQKSCGQNERIRNQMSWLTEGRVAQYLTATAGACECEQCADAIKAGTLSADECACDKHFCVCCGGDHYCTENDR